VSTAEKIFRLGDVCSFQAGFAARERLEPAEHTGRLALQLRDLTDGDDVNLGALQRFLLPDLPQRYAVQPGDVVFRSRGAANTAHLMPAGTMEPIFALMPLFVLRPDPAVVVPEYIVWAINHTDAQRQIDAEAQGTSLRMVAKQALEQILIPVPDIATQRLIVMLAALASAEADLLQQLAHKRLALVNQMLSAAAHGGAQQKGVRQ
jgi:hypothetical protein